MTTPAPIPTPTRGAEDDWDAWAAAHPTQPESAATDNATSRAWLRQAGNVALATLAALLVATFAGLAVWALRGTTVGLPAVLALVVVLAIMAVLAAVWVTARRRLSWWATAIAAVGMAVAVGATAVGAATDWVAFGLLVGALVALALAVFVVWAYGRWFYRHA